MFSDITDAWENDPVKEITNKLSNRSCVTDDNPFRFKNAKNKINNSRAKQNDGYVSLSENSINLSDYTPYAPVNFGKKSKKYSFNTSDLETSESSDSVLSSKCSFSTRHIKKCSGCHDRLKKMINKKVTKKFDEMLLDHKMKQLQTMPSQAPQAQPSVVSESWKEILIIVVGSLIALFIIFMIVRCLNK